MWQYPGTGQEPGRSWSKSENFPADLVFRVDIPAALKEMGYWWTETKNRAQEQDLVVSYRPKRYSASGPGWYTFSVCGYGGAQFLEEALKQSLWWHPDLSVEDIKLPSYGDVFPTTAVQDVLNNIKEYVIEPPSGIVLLDWRKLRVRVVGHESGADLVLRARWRRRVRRRRHGPQEESGLRSHSEE